MGRSFVLRNLRSQAGFLTIISALGNGIVPYVTGQFFDSLIKPQDINIGFGFIFPLFIITLIVWLIAQVITSIVEWRITVSSLVISHTIWCDYMSKGIGKILLVPMSFHKDNNASSLIHKVDMAASSIDKIFSEVLIKLTPKFKILLL